MFNSTNLDLMSPSQMIEIAHYEGDRLHKRLADLYEDEHARNENIDVQEARSAVSDLSSDIDSLETLLEKELRMIAEGRTKADRIAWVKKLLEEIDSRLIDMKRSIEYAMDNLDV